MNFADCEEFSACLAGLDMFRMDLDLERMARGLRGLDLSRPYTIAQIVGTNGKGSTARFLASLAEAHGLKAGLFTSPHMISPSERILINGKALSGERLLAVARRVSRVAPDPTYFEYLCLMAALAFAEEKVDLAVMEAGLGGRFDATTALPADLVCFTPMSRDHTDVLGGSLREIVADKAAAMRARTPALTGRQSPEAMSLLLNASRHMDVPLIRAAEICALPADLDMRLRGPHQEENAAVALAAWIELARQRAWPVSESAVRKGLESAFMPGRLQSVPANDAHPDLLLDGAHNTHAFAALREALPKLDIFPDAVIFSCLADKDVKAVTPLVLDLAMEAPIFVPPVANNPRAANPHEIAASLGGGARAVPGLGAALKEVALRKTTPQSPVLICGSLYLLGEFFSLFPDCLEYA
jgi:dihydrofolate synthase/folylpolyglutamate synthase